MYIVSTNVDGRNRVSALCPVPFISVLYWVCQLVQPPLLCEVLIAAIVVILVRLYPRHVAAYCPFSGNVTPIPSNGNQPLSQAQYQQPVPATNYPYHAPAQTNTQYRKTVQFAPNLAQAPAPASIQANSPASSAQPYIAHKTELLDDSDSEEEVERIAVHILMKVKSHEVLALVDSGAEVTIIPRSLVENLQLKPTRLEV